MPVVFLGSSPLTRGKHSRAWCMRTRVGIIPAHAGKTHTACSALADTEDHPRSRGENRAQRARAHQPQGSSPLTRGKPDNVAGLAQRIGIIPAHAGKTFSMRTCGTASRDHPRSRGENQGEPVGPFAALGSSPLTRGKQSAPPRPDRRPGIIPAHAGKTCQSPSGSGCARDHPRSRGENIVSVDQPRRGPGSSPLTRGKRYVTVLIPPATGIIPAHAGKTEARGYARGSGEDHPRSRGENIARARAIAQAKGSSPLTRGKPLNGSIPFITRRIIPAHAGKTGRLCVSLAP